MKGPPENLESSSTTDTSPGTTDDGTIRVPIVEEQVVVGKTEVERVSARIALRTRVEDVPVSESLRTERADIERVSIGSIVAEAPVMRVEDGVTIIPVVEEILVRQFRIIEEIRVTSHIETVEHDEVIALRRQEAVIDERPDDAAGSSASPTRGTD